jgi:hypothetical protein
MIDENLALELYLSGMTYREVAARLCCAYSSVGRIIRKFGKSRDKKIRVEVLQKKGNTCDLFSIDFVRFLDGLLISDGFLSRPKGVSLCCFYEQYSCNYGFLQFVKKRFSMFGIESRIFLDKRKRKKKKKKNWILRTKSYDKFFLFRKKWYNETTKVVPHDLDFTHVDFLKNWVYGDGTLIRNSTFRFCTDSFSEQEIDNLVKRLNRHLGVSFKKMCVGLDKNDNYKFRPCLCVRDGLDLFFEKIGKPIKSFEYKWRII